MKSNRFLLQCAASPLLMSGSLWLLFFRDFPVNERISDRDAFHMPSFLCMRNDRVQKSLSEPERVIFFRRKERPNYMVLPAAAANCLSFSIRRVNLAGFRDWGPSEEACSGSECTSIISPSAPAATAAQAMEAT